MGCKNHICRRWLYIGVGGIFKLDIHLDPQLLYGLSMIATNNEFTSNISLHYSPVAILVYSLPLSLTQHRNNMSG
jgi:hypothetical protein